MTQAVDVVEVFADAKPLPQPPYDFDKLSKGMSIPIDELERIIGHTRFEEAYRTGLLSMRDAARKARPELWPHIRTDHGALRVMLDSEAIEYNQKLIKESEERIKRIAAGLQMVDVEKLTSDQRRAKDLYDQHNAMRVVAIRQIRDKQARSFGALVGKNQKQLT